MAKYFLTDAFRKDILNKYESETGKPYSHLACAQFVVEHGYSKKSAETFRKILSQKNRSFVGERVEELLFFLLGTTETDIAEFLGHYLTEDLQQDASSASEEKTIKTENTFRIDTVLKSDPILHLLYRFLPTKENKFKHALTAIVLFFLYIFITYVWAYLTGVYDGSAWVEINEANQYPLNKSIAMLGDLIHVITPVLLYKYYTEIVTALNLLFKNKIVEDYIGVSDAILGKRRRYVSYWSIGVSYLLGFGLSLFLHYSFISDDILGWEEVSKGHLSALGYYRFVILGLQLSILFSAINVSLTTFSKYNRLKVFLSVENADFEEETETYRSLVRINHLHLSIVVLYFFLFALFINSIFKYREHDPNCYLWQVGQVSIIMFFNFFSSPLILLLNIYRTNGLQLAYKDLLLSRYRQLYPIVVDSIQSFGEIEEHRLRRKKYEELKQKKYSPISNIGYIALFILLISSAFFIYRSFEIFMCYIN